MRFCTRASIAILGALGFPAITAGIAHAESAQGVDDSTRNTARDLAAQGKAAFTAGDMEKARDLFGRAYALVPAPTIAMYEGRALVSLHRFVEAEEAYMRAVRTNLDAEASEQFKSAKDTAESELLALRPRIPKVLIRLTGPGATDSGVTVKLDGNDVNRAVVGVEMPIDPGAHEVVAAAPGGAPGKQSFTIAESEHREVKLDVPRGSGTAGAAEGFQVGAGTAPGADSGMPAKSDGGTQRTIGIAVAGVGVAGLAAGVVTGLMAASKHSQADEQCKNHVCVEGSSGADALDSFRSLRTVSTIGYVVGGLGLAGGAVLYFTAPKAPVQSASLRPFIGVDRVGVAGAF